jgi:pyrimidine-nucleoside phosphorylase
MQSSDLIRKKRDGESLSSEEIAWFIEQYTHERIPDYQMAAWLMAVLWRGMDKRETSDLTLAMTRSGELLRIRDSVFPVVDKHSTGGVGDKVTLAVAPLVAACGVVVGKMSGRGLGHTGGTIDKLESIPGFQATLSRQQFLHILRQHGIVIAGQSHELAPADGKMYALRDVTATVDSIPLIAASIMSKKLAIGGSHLLLDVKYGSGAFIKTTEQACELAQTMVEIGRTAGMHTVAAITSMEQPLGHAIGNALEVAEAVAILRGQGPQDVAELCYHEAAELLVMTAKARDMHEAEQQVQKVIHAGAGVTKFAEVVAAQGGDARYIEHPELLPTAPYKTMLPAPRTGYIAGIHAEKIGLASMRLGAGRFKKGDAIDYRTGLVLQAKTGAYIRQGEPLLEVHARSEDDAQALQTVLLDSYTWSDEPVQPEPLIFDTIRP